MKIDNNFDIAGCGRIFFLFLFFMFITCSICHAEDYSCEKLTHPDGSVAFCFDGDTFKLTDRRIVRLAGIDAPELGKQGKKIQFYARQAKEELIKLARGKKIKLILHAATCRDNHGRILAEALVDGDHSINKMMIERGAAFFFPQQNLDPYFQKELLGIQAEAIKERRGLWNVLLSLPIANYNYIGNKASMRFFPESCPEVQNIKPRNRIHFGTLMDAFLSGFAPARSCTFWPDAS